MKKILLFSRDPGGANTIIPLVEPLLTEGYKVALFGKDIAMQKYEKSGLKGVDIDSVLNFINLESIISFLKRESPDFIITATSADDFTEKYIWKAATILNIKSFAILDQWVNYGIRFSDYGVSELKEYERTKKHNYLPDYILVMDEDAKKELIVLGIDKSKVIITGQPHFDFLSNKTASLKKVDIDKLRENLGIHKSEFFITYASEPISKTYNENDDSEHYWGYSERTIFKEIIDSLSRILPNIETNIRFIIKLHPKENYDNYNDLISNVDSKRIQFQVDSATDPYMLILSSDLVCGMSSMFLLEAVLLGKPVLSVQIGLKRENPLILDKKGILRSVLDKSALDKALQRLINKVDLPIINYRMHDGAVNNVIRFMEELL